MADASCGLRGVIIGLEIALKRGTEANIMNLGRHALTKGTKISISMAFAMMNGEKIRTPLCIFLVIMYAWIYICPSPGSLGWCSGIFGGLRSVNDFSLQNRVGKLPPLLVLDQNQEGLLLILSGAPILILDHFHV